MDFIEVNISDDQVRRAKERDHGKKLRGSITNGEGNLYGSLGEIIVIDHFSSLGLDVGTESTYDYDITIESHTIDVKTKRVTSVPKGNYLCSISNFNTRQNCEFYLFCRVHDNLKKGYILGYMGKDNYFKQSVFNRKGELDPSSDRGWRFKDDCYNLPISKLKKFKSQKA